jgi:hypothetical protein
MQTAFLRYQRVGHRFVEGWLDGEVLTVLSAVDLVQRSKGVTGPVAEIGVHHGKLFIALKLLQRPGECSIAIDVFGDQHLNVDRSGEGDLERFHKNLKRWASTGGLAVHTGDSTKLNPHRLLELAGSPIRLFSIDGGHTAQIVASDMRLAEATLAAGGVVIADDVFNPKWPGVSVGAMRYLDRGGALTPFLIGFNKVLFARPEHCAEYRKAVEAAFRDRRLIEAKESVYASHEVSILYRLPPTPRNLLHRNTFARSVYRRVRSQ